MAKQFDYSAYYTSFGSGSKARRGRTMADILGPGPGEPFSFGNNIPEKYRFLNPQTIADLSVKEQRKYYSELRSIARKRADRLEAAGFKARRFDQVNKVDSGDLAESLAELSYYLRSPGSSVKVARKQKEQASLAAHGYNVENVREFGKFMDAFRYRYKNRKIPDSGPYAVIYHEAERRNMTVKTLQREFGAYLNELEDAKKLRDALLSAPERTKGSDRLTARNLKNILAKK